MNLYALFFGLALFGFCSCDNDDSVTPDPQARQAFESKYPNATQEEWEKKNAAASVSFDSGGVVEFLPIEMFSKDAKIEKGGGIKGMLISMCDCACEDEISEIVSSNDEIRKLRDALNKYLES